MSAKGRKTPALFLSAFIISQQASFASGELLSLTDLPWHRIINWFKTRKGVQQSWILSLCLFNLHAEFSSVAQSCPTLCDPMYYSTPGSPVHHQLLELDQTHVHRAGDANQPSHPLSSLLLLHSIFPSIRVFSNESVLRMRWSKYWSFRFSISPSNEYSGLISFRMD